MKGIEDFRFQISDSSLVESAFAPHPGIIKLLTASARRLNPPPAFRDEKIHNP